MKALGEDFDVLAWARETTMAQTPVMLAGQQAMITSVTTDIGADDTLRLTLEIRPLKG